MKTIKKIAPLILALITNLCFGQEDVMKITESGNVNIGSVNNPKEKLEVEGNVNANGKIKENGNDLMPKGAIIMWTGGTNPPAGWAICDGGTYNGIKTPDLRDRFIVGAGKTYKKDSIGGAAMLILTEAQMPKHKHELNFNGKTGNDAKNFKNDQGWAENGFTAVYATDRDGSKSEKPMSEKGGSLPFDNRPPFYAVYFIMKL